MFSGHFTTNFDLYTILSPRDAREISKMIGQARHEELEQVHFPIMGF